jgi:hypothetical protein
MNDTIPIPLLNLRLRLAAPPLRDGRELFSLGLDLRVRNGHIATGGLIAALIVWVILVRPRFRVQLADGSSAPALGHRLQRRNLRRGANGDEDLLGPQQLRG